MTDPKPRRTRTAWPGPLSTAGVPPQHTHELPRALRRSYRLLLVAVVGLLLAVGTLTYFVYQQQQYIEGKGDQRDMETARLHEQIRVSMCDLLDQLPEGGLLDRPRTKYGCGPGIPLASLTPQEQAQVRRAPSPPGTSAATSPPTSAPRRSDAASAGASPARPETPAPAPTSPSLSPGPLDPLTTPVCNALGVCI